MPEIEIEGFGLFELEEGRRLVNAIEDCGVELGHRCGGQANCTTCRVEFLEGEPVKMTEAEYEKLEETNQLGNYRLSCQIKVDRRMKLRPLMLLEDFSWDDAGPRPAEVVEPEAEWFSPVELEKAD